MADLLITIETLPAATVVTLVGEARLHLEVLERHFLTIMAAKPKVVLLDMAGVVFCSSLGIGTIISLRNGVKRHEGVVKLVGLKGTVLDTFQKSRVTSLFDLHQTVEQALAAGLEKPARSDAEK